jgi:hypothetical protein
MRDLNAAPRVPAHPSGPRGVSARPASGPREATTSPVTGRPLQVQVGLRHLLTSFGYTVDANVFWREDAANVFVILHSYFNGERYFPGVEAELLRHPVRVGGRALYVTPRLAAWFQPEGQRFRTERAEPGALASVRVETQARRVLAPFKVLGESAAGGRHCDAGERDGNRYDMAFNARAGRDLSRPARYSARRQVSCKPARLRWSPCRPP